MSALELSRTYQAFTCGCPEPTRLWLERPRHMTCTWCGHLITPIELVDRRAADYYRGERDALVRGRGS